MQVKQVTLPQGQQKINLQGNVVPLVLEPAEPCQSEDAAMAYLQQHEQDLENLITKHGAILYRNFPFYGAQGFLNFVQSFGKWEIGSYLGGGGPRKIILGPIQSSTESPPHMVIPLHHELAYLTTPPSKVMFYCDVPTEEDGETPLCDSNVLLNKIAEAFPEFIQQLKEKKVRYVRNVADKSTCTNEYQRSWQDIFETNDKQEAEERAKATGTETIVWLENNVMQVTSIAMDAIRLDARAQLKTWFNSVILLHPAAHGYDPKTSPWTVLYGDYSEMDAKHIVGAAQIMQQEQIKFKWQKHDILVVDNYLALHARNSFKGPRKIFATIVK